MSIPRLSPDEAAHRVYTTLRRDPGTEQIPTAEGCQRTLAQALHAPVSLPPFDASAMDGYAYRAETLPADLCLPRVGSALAGHPFTDTVPPGHCVRITTGAALPAGTDTVVIQENVDAREGDIVIHTRPEAGANVRQAGHDIQAGALMHNPGQRLTAFHCAALAASGIAEVTVAQRPRVAVFSTGDELVSPGAVLGPGQIYDSNRLLVRSALDSNGVHWIDGGLLPDDRAALREALGAVDADLIVTSGGVSVGDADFLTELLQTEGELDFWRLNLKPGKPLAFGRYGNTPFLGLPGNPVSTAITALLFVRPAIAALSGGTEPDLTCWPATLGSAIRRRGGREEFQRGIAMPTQGQLIVTSSGDQSSNRLQSFSEANCLIRLQSDQTDLQPGAGVEIIPLFGLVPA
ncbi:MAG: gephyrin-like molybdotransferase Glp [Pseudomonadota bacterium]